MMKTKLMVGTVVAVFALAVSTSMVDAHTTSHHHAAKPAAVGLSSSPPASLHCKKGETYVLHTTGTMHWGCVKV